MTTALRCTFENLLSFPRFHRSPSLGETQIFQSTGCRAGSRSGFHHERYRIAPKSARDDRLTFDTEGEIIIVSSG